MKRPASARILDAATACADILEFTAGKDFAAFGGDRVLRAAVERQFTIIGEALNRAVQAEPALLSEIADIPQVIALRNRVIHAYETVDDQIIWDIVQADVPALEIELRRWLRERGHA